VHGALQKKGSSGIVEPDMRGKHAKHKAVSSEDKELIRKHIASFKTVESHYCREKTERQYLPSELSITRMFKMYKEQCLKLKQVHQKEIIYRRIFNNEFNLHFFRPKKDQCDFCTAYRNTQRKSEVVEKLYKVHMKQKTLARQAKQDAKDAAKADRSLMAACFDLEKVLNCPHVEASSYYYHRKLSLYNLSVYSLGSGDVYCYLWNETQAKRGANEIASCLLKFLKKQVKAGYKSFVFFSDNCAGQNRNRFIATLWWYAVTTLRNITSITHNYLDVGHTQNENDTVHSTIERVSRRASLYTPEQWSAVIATASSKKSYNVTDMQVKDFLDFKTASQCVRNFAVTEDGDRVRWNKLCSMSFSSQNPDKMHIRYKFDKDSTCVDLVKTPRETRKSRHTSLQLKQLYSKALPLPAAKYKDLMTLCQKKLIPQGHHAFFKALPHEAVE